MGGYLGFGIPGQDPVNQGPIVKWPTLQDLAQANAGSGGSGSSGSDNQKDKKGFLGGIFGGNDKFNPNDEYLADLQQRWEQYQNLMSNPEALGLSEDEIAQRAALAQQQAMAAQQAALELNNRAALAGTSVQAGALAQNAKNLTDQGSAAAASATAEAERVNQQLINQRIDQLREEMLAAADKKRNVFEWGWDKLIGAIAGLGGLAEKIHLPNIVPASGGGSDPDSGAGPPGWGDNKDAGTGVINTFGT